MSHGEDTATRHPTHPLLMRNFIPAIGALLAIGLLGANTASPAPAIRAPRPTVTRGPAAATIRSPTILPVIINSEKAA